MIDLQAINEIRSKIQKEALIQWFYKGCQGTVIAATAVGKTRLGVIAAGRHIRKDNGEKWLILAPRVNLLENEWPEEFIKAGYQNEFSSVTTATINTAREWNGTHWDGVIVDEVHLCLSEENVKFFQNNTWDKLLCLTAGIENEDYKNIINRLAPVCYEINIDKALELGLVSDFYVFNYPVEFTDAERKAYIEIQKDFNKFFVKFEYDFQTATQAIYDPETVAIQFGANSKNKDFLYRVGSVAEAARGFNKAMHQRKQSVFGAINKPTVVREIIDYFKEERSIVFSETQKAAKVIQEELSYRSVLYHSGLTKKYRKQALEAFKSDLTKVNTISAVKALDVGLNVPSCSVGVVASGNSKYTQASQRRGRILRTEEGKIAKLIQLYIPNTVEEKWVQKRFVSEPSISVKWIKNLSDIHNFLNS